MKNIKLLSVIASAGIMLGMLSGCTGAAAGVSSVDDGVVKSSMGDGIQNVSVKSHNAEAVSGSEYGEQYTVKDTVSVSYKAGDLGGLVPQTVTKELYFYQDKDTQQWSLMGEKTTACDVNNDSLKGTTWKCENLDQDSVSKLFGDEVPQGQTGVVYIRIMKKIGLFAVKLDDANTTSTERYFMSVGTNANVVWVGDNAKVETKCSIPSGFVTDSGVLNLDFEGKDSVVNISFGADCVAIPEQEYDSATGKEVDASKVYMDSLPVFNVTTASIENGEWKQETGLMIDNVSPELTWTAVDGATKYAVIMLDTSTNNWLSWFVIVDDITHLDEGTYTEKEVYVGPYPPGTHTYEVFVRALRTEPQPVSFPMDASGGDINAKMNFLNVASDGSYGNVLAYGTIKADYTAAEMYYGYR